MARLCSQDGCGRRYIAKGYCPGHYRQLMAGEEMRPLIPYMKRPDGFRHNEADALRTQGQSVLSKKVGYVGAHTRCYKLWGRASQYACVACVNRARQWAYDGTDPSEILGTAGNKSWTRYSLFPEFYMPMCGTCHASKDKGRAADELYEYREWKHRTGLTLADIDERLEVFYG